MMKTIFITGASTGLGHATTRLFTQNGWKVIATMRQPESATDLSTLPNTILLPLDVTDPGQISKTVQTAIGMGEIDVVFNNAGYGLIDSPEATSDEQILRQINTNLLGVIRTTKAFIPHFRTRATGSSFPRAPLAVLSPSPLTRSITLPNGRWKAGAKAWHLN